MEGKLGEYQTGCRPNRSTVDNIFILRQMYEKCYEHNIELHNAFIDFNQAFDSINRSTVIKVLKEMQIPGKIVQGGSNMTGTDFFFVTIIAHHSSNSQTGLNRF